MRRVRGPRREAVFVALFFTLSALPFVGRPIHIDEPIFSRAAEQITQRPMDSYGFEMNWTGTVQPVYQVMMNPPLASYCIAPSAFFVGWSETALHACFALVGLIAVLGTFVVAARFSERPFAFGPPRSERYLLQRAKRPYPFPDTSGGNGDL